MTYGSRGTQLWATIGPHCDTLAKARPHQAKRWNGRVSWTRLLFDERRSGKGEITETCIVAGGVGKKDDGGNAGALKMCTSPG